MITIYLTTRMYSTTISKTVNTKPTAITNFKEEKFLIKTDAVKSARCVEHSISVF